MFLYSLLALAVVTALIFAAPLKAKVWATLAVVAAGALWASATAVGVLAGGHTVRLWATDVFLFGSDAGSMDPLSALFALIVSVVMGVIAIVQKIMGVALGGFTTVIILLLFLGSLIMISLGIIGYYVGNIYEEIKDRPRYIVAQTCGDETP